MTALYKFITKAHSVLHNLQMCSFWFIEMKYIYVPRYYGFCFSRHLHVRLIELPINFVNTVKIEKVI
jgi:hypothetical protein